MSPCSRSDLLRRATGYQSRACIGWARSAISAYLNSLRTYSVSAHHRLYFRQLPCLIFSKSNASPRLFKSWPPSQASSCALHTLFLSLPPVGQAWRSAYAHLFGSFTPELPASSFFGPPDLCRCMSACRWSSWLCHLTYLRTILNLACPRRR